MGVFKTENKAETRPYTYQEILEVAVQSDYDLLEDMARTSTDRKNLGHLTNLSRLMQEGANDSVGDFSVDLLDCLKENPLYPTDPQEIKDLLN